jgi:poly-beta-1,6-N-acetyl-D-glucosamine synthase
MDRYCLITPCRDEATYARRTLDSIVNQTVRPALWVIVDDGSTDETPAILAEYAAKHPFIRVVRREDRGKRAVGPGVVDAFYAGYSTIDPKAFDYVCKLDLDLDIPERYFETLMARMRAEPRIGTCSGKPYFPGKDGQLVSEACGDEMSVGMIKFYRTACFEQIGGFVREVMWDGIDCHRCRMMGWIACSWDEPELRFIHLRPMGSSQQGIFTGRMRHGYGQWFMGTGLAYMTASAMFRMTRPPYLVGGLAMWWGFVWAMLKMKSRYEDHQFRSFLRRYQWDCLLRGKGAATRRLNERQAGKWVGSQRASDILPTEVGRPRDAQGTGSKLPVAHV